MTARGKRRMGPSYRKEAKYSAVSKKRQKRLKQDRYRHRDRG